MYVCMCVCVCGLAHHRGRQSPARSGDWHACTRSQTHTPEMYVHNYTLYKTDIYLYISFMYVSTENIASNERRRTAASAATWPGCAKLYLVHATRCWLLLMRVHTRTHSPLFAVPSYERSQTSVHTHTTEPPPPPPHTFDRAYTQQTAAGVNSLCTCARAVQELSRAGFNVWW